MGKSEGRKRNGGREDEDEGEGEGDGLLKGLVICVTGICKEARKHVMEVTSRLGGTYSPNLHPKCTHLLVHSFGVPTRKLHHALLHASTNPLFVVSFSWFFDSLTSYARLPESPYSLHLFSNPSIQMGATTVYDSCFPLRKLLHNPSQQLSDKLYNSECNSQGYKHSPLSGHSIYIDSALPAQLHSKVANVVAIEGAMLVDQWFVGCGADFVVCEVSSIHKYLGHCDNIVSPIWLLKTSKARSLQRFVCLSADLARETVLMLDSLQRSSVEQETNKENCCQHTCTSNRSGVSQAERLKYVKLAKRGIRNRRARRLQLCAVPLRPINSGSLLESICWSISEPTSAASVYEDVLLSNDKSELVFRNHFLTILFPVDRFSEIGPLSRTYFSDSGFTCLQLLDFVYDFYQESMSGDEIRAAIHTDSRHAELLRSRYCSEGAQVGDMVYKRIQFLGSRKNFEMLKRVNGDNNSNVYELLIRE